MADEAPKIIVKETIVLKKFDGDDQTKEPVETITIELKDGVEVKQTVVKKEGEQHGTD